MLRFTVVVCMSQLAVEKVASVFISVVVLLLTPSQLALAADVDTFLKLLYVLWDNADSLSIPPKVELPTLMALPPESITY